MTRRLPLLKNNSTVETRLAVRELQVQEVVYHMQRVVVKITDVETGAEQLSGDLTVLPGYGFSCSCSSSSLTTVVDQAAGAIKSIATEKAPTAKDRT